MPQIGPFKYLNSSYYYRQTLPKLKIDPTILLSSPTRMLELYHSKHE